MNDSNNDFEKLAFKKQSSTITMVTGWPRREVDR